MKKVIQILTNLLKAVNGYKTYIISGVGVLYTLTQVWDGQMTFETALYAILASLGLGTMKHAVSKVETKVTK